MNKLKWDLNPLFKSENDPKIRTGRKKIEKESYKFINKWRNRNDYLENPKILSEALSEYENWTENSAGGGDEGYYFWLKLQQKQSDPEIKAAFNKVSGFSVKIENSIRFFTLNLAKIPEKTQKKLLTAPELKNYRHFLELVFARARFLLSEPEEKIMNLKSDVAHSNWVQMTSEFLAKEEKIIPVGKNKNERKSFPEILSLTQSKDKKIRDSAAESLNKILNDCADVAEHEMNSILRNKEIDDELRKMPRPDLSRHISADIDSKTVDSLIESVSARFEVSQKYYRLKARLMGVKKLEYHERNTEYGKADKKYPFNEAVKMTESVFKNLDPEFHDIFKKFLKSGQIDAYPQKGRSDGAFCAHYLKIHPVYVLLNHTGRLHDVTTLAHEMGHAVHFELSRRRQNALNFGTALSTAEVASTFMEDFILEELIKEAGKETRLAIMMMKLNEDVSTIFRQIACYRFEQELHKTFREKGYLSKNEIGKSFQKHMAEYMGASVRQSPGSENWWVYWGHIRNFFYNYSYASGLLISKYLQGKVKENPEFIKKVKEFLSAGVSDSPKNIFKKMGIDIDHKNFWNQGLDEVENLLDETVKLAKKLGKLG